MKAFGIREERLAPYAVFIMAIGFVMVVFGVWNVSREYRRIHSPLDRITEGREIKQQEAPNRANQVLPVQSDEFLPLYSPAGGDSSTYAPDMNKSSEPVKFSLLVAADPPAKQGGALPEGTFQAPAAEPERLMIPSLGVEAFVVPVSSREVEYLGDTYQQWLAPSSGDLGWHSSSAKLGKEGNTVINGHSSGYGESFRGLEKLKNGDVIHVQAGHLRYTYVVANTIILKERWESIETRMANARWMHPSEDERLTLISCWPYPSNSHRVVVVATPVGVDVLRSPPEISRPLFLPE
ncbi:MAG: sortase [Anaerolineales bacterium]